MKFTLPSVRHLTPFAITIIVMCCLLILPKNFIAAPGLGIDSSWAISINMIYKESLLFGKDFVFTYGPLGFLNTRYDFAIGIIPFIIADLLTISCGIYILLIVWNKIRDPLTFLSIPYLILLVSLNYEINFLYFSFFFFLILHFHFDKNILSGIIAGLLAVILFFIKLNVGLIAVVALQLFLTYHIPWKKGPLHKNILILFIPAGLIMAVSAFLPIDLSGYIKGSIEIVNYYNDAMFNVDHIENASRLSYFDFLIAAIVICTLAWLFLSCFLKIITVRNNFILALWLLLALYIGWKQAFTRYDPFRGTYFFYYGAIFIGAACIFAEEASFKKSLNYIFILLILISPLVSTGLGFSYNNFSLPYQDLFLMSPDARNRQQETFKESVRLDPITRKLIGDQPTDIFPSEIAYAYFNELTYAPRPAIQSYQAYSEYLTHLNYLKYTSPDAPEFILYTPASMDQYRYLLWSDSQAWLAMLQNYEYQHTTTDSVIVLRKRNTILDLNPGKSLEKEIKMGHIYQITPKKSLTLMKAEVSYSLWGKICRILVRPPVLYARVWYDDNSSQVIKAILPELKGGVLLKKINGINDTAQLFASKGSGSPSVTRFQFLGASGGFQNNIKITLNDLKIQ